jgi:hypothetical protein
MSGERDDDFVVIDKRAASGATEDAPAADAPRGDAAKAGASTAEGETPEPGPRASRGSASPAPADFAMLVQPFFVAALYHMGLAADPETGNPGARNLPLARHNIDILEVIAEKTRGNLSGEEQQLLEGVLYELRMNFIKVGKVSGE